MESAVLTSAIGARVKHERQSRRWTLDQLADATGVSRRQLVHLEQGTTNPSIGLLLKVSAALGVGLPALVEPPEPASLQVTRCGGGAVLWTGASGGRAVLVAGTSPPDVVELWDWTLGVGDRYASDAHASGTRELVQVQQGAVLVRAGEQSADLQVGDAAAFRGDVPHVYANASAGPARFCLAVFEPGVGAHSGGGAGRA